MLAEDEETDRGHGQGNDRSLLDTAEQARYTASQLSLGYIEGVEGPERTAMAEAASSLAESAAGLARTIIAQYAARVRR